MTELCKAYVIPYFEEGFQGHQGYQGATGVGYQGYQGEPGIGYQGHQGANGAGYQGYQGYQGEIGIGYQGYQGASGSGYQGYQGYQGANGVGYQGYQGYQGETGVGYQGYQGENGVGYQGYQGYQGETGIGYQGYQGYAGAIVGQTSASATFLPNTPLVITNNALPFVVGFAAPMWNISLPSRYNDPGNNLNTNGTTGAFTVPQTGRYNVSFKYSYATPSGASTLTFQFTNVPPFFRLIRNSGGAIVIDSSKFTSSFSPQVPFRIAPSGTVIIVGDYELLQNDTLIVVYDPGSVDMFAPAVITGDVSFSIHRIA